MSTVVISALYKFVKLENYKELREDLFKFMESKQIRGTLILAHEGINGTVAGSQDSIDSLKEWFNQTPYFKGIESKESFTNKMPFYRTKVKLKKEIVTLGVEDIDPNQIVGTYLNPNEWNELLADPEVTVIDTRNDYEFKIGTFKNAINPNTKSFREFPNYVKKHLSPEKNKKVAMFCTGGIRCEKSTAYLKKLGFKDVFHLKGGILKYLEEMPKENSIWNGECFVFDDRVTVTHQLEKGTFELCNACRNPLSEEDKKNEKYQKGVSCPQCFDLVSEEKKISFAQRQKQFELAELRGEAHFGDDARKLMIEKRELKKLKKKPLEHKN